MTIATRNFVPGVYAPLLTPFIEGTNEIDIDAFVKQVLRVAQVGVQLVIFGTNGEASHLSREERIALITAARKALDEQLIDVPLLVGTGTGSAVETVKYCQDAAQAGADGVIVISPGYYAFRFVKDISGIKEFFRYVLDNSPLRVMIYNFPGAASGLDLNSDDIIELANHSNCIGVKLTCANIGKGLRIAAHTQSEEYRAQHPVKQTFLVFPGYSDYLLPALVARQHGCITGLANLFPKTLAKLYNTAAQSVKDPSPENLAKAQELQQIVSDIDWVMLRAGLPGAKYALNELVEKGLGGIPRLPLLPANQATKDLIDANLPKAFEFENSL